MECCTKRHLLGGGALVGRGTFQTSHNKETQDDRGRRLDGDLSGTNKKSKLAKAYSTMEMVKLLQNMRVVEGVSETLICDSCPDIVKKVGTLCTRTVKSFLVSSHHSFHLSLPHRSRPFWHKRASQRKISAISLSVESMAILSIASWLPRIKIKQ